MANAEQLLKLHPDIIILMEPGSPASIDRLNQLQSQPHIPTYLFDMRLRNTPEVYETLGALLGVEKRAQQLANYSRSVLTEADAKLRNLPQEKRPRVYLASGVDGLQTTYDGAPHAESIPVAGGFNVARSAQAQQGRRVAGVLHGRQVLSRPLEGGQRLVVPPGP